LAVKFRRPLARTRVEGPLNDLVQQPGRLRSIVAIDEEPNVEVVPSISRLVDVEQQGHNTDRDRPRRVARRELAAHLGL
jgi:hypothetical protein